MASEHQQRRRSTLRPHVVRDQIVEFMGTYARPISPTQLARATGASVGSVAYHMRMLAAAGVLVLAEEHPVRGAIEHFYALASGVRQGPLVDPPSSLLALCGALTVADPDGGYPRFVVLDDDTRAKLEAVIGEITPTVQAIAEGVAQPGR